LLAAGFQFEGRNKPSKPLHLYLDYPGPGGLFRLSWDRRDSDRFIGVTAELLGPSDRHTTIAATSFSGVVGEPKRRITPVVQMQIDSFVDTVNAFMSDLPL
jgi:hypothetical protein